MAQDELELASDQGNLLNLEKVGKDAAMADEVFGLVGKSQFFSEFSREDILLLADRGEQQHMTSVGPGLTLGEMSMIDGEPRFATCLATRPTVFAVLSRDNMAKIILDHPDLGSKILVKLVTMLSLRLRQTSAKLLNSMEGGR
jgi:CRP-like cAMP-binding protein